MRPPRPEWTAPGRSRAGTTWTICNPSFACVFFWSEYHKPVNAVYVRRCCLRHAARTTKIKTAHSFPLPELDATADITVVALIVADALVVVLGVLVHPYFRQTHAVPLQHVYPGAPLKVCQEKQKEATLTTLTHSPNSETNLIRRAFPEYMADMRARNDFQRTAAHPCLERQLQILTAPNIEARIVRAQALEKLTIDGEQTAGHRWRPNRFGRILKRLPY